MSKEPGIYIKNEVVRDAHHPTVGNGQIFKDGIAALIDAGNVVAVGENGIERTFDDSQEFKDWFDSMKPIKEQLANAG